MNGAQCVPLCTLRTTRKWTLQLRHVCDFSPGLAESWIKMGQSNILQQIFFPQRKWQDLKCARCGSDSGKLIKAVLRRAAAGVKPENCKLHLPVTLPTFTFLTQGFTLWCPKCCTTDWNCSSQHDQTHWNGNILPIYGFISCWACVKELCSKRVQSQLGNIWVRPKISDDFLPIPRYFKYILQAFLGHAWRSGLHLQSQLQKLVTQEVRKSS